jgi:hypothetical protein
MRHIRGQQHAGSSHHTGDSKQGLVSDFHEKKTLAAGYDF